MIKNWNLPACALKPFSEICTKLPEKLTTCEVFTLSSTKRLHKKDAQGHKGHSLFAQEKKEWCIKMKLELIREQ